MFWVVADRPVWQDPLCTARGPLLTSDLRLVEPRKRKCKHISHFIDPLLSSAKCNVRSALTKTFFI